MNVLMALMANRHNVEPGLLGVAPMVMVLIGGISANHAGHHRSSWQPPLSYIPVHNLPCFSLWRVRVFSLIGNYFLSIFFVRSPLYFPDASPIVSPSSLSVLRPAFHKFRVLLGFLVAGLFGLGHLFGILLSILLRIGELFLFVFSVILPEPCLSRFGVFMGHSSKISHVEFQPKKGMNL